MQDLKAFSDALEEWRESPVTRALREAMGKVLARRKRLLVSSYLSGKAAPEDDRKACLMVERWVEDFFESSAEDVMEAMRDDKDE